MIAKVVRRLRARRHQGDGSGEAGEAVIEIVLAVPVFILFVGAVIYLGALALGAQQMDGVVQQGPPAALAYGNRDQAYNAAAQAMFQQANQSGLKSCSVFVGGNWSPGGNVSTAATCRIDTGGVLPGAPRYITISRSSESPITPFHATTP